MHTVLIFGLIACVSPLWSLPRKQPTMPPVEFEQIRYSYCIANACEPFDDCHMYSFCRYAQLHKKQLGDKEMGTLTDYAIQKNITIQLFDSRVKLLPDKLS